MTARQFFQDAQGYGSTQTTATVTLDGIIIFDGSIPTVDQPIPSMPNQNANLPQAYSWEGTMEFSGQIPITIDVQGSDLYLGGTTANTWLGNTWTNQGAVYIQEIDGQLISDPFTNVQINGIAQTRLSSPTGQWWWIIPAGSEFKATLNITASPTPSAP